MDLDKSRLLLLSAPTTPLWTGTVTTYNAELFRVTVATVSGTFPTDIANLLLIHQGVYIARIKSRDGDDLYLAETPVQFAETFPVEIYDARLPWPRYQYIDEGVVYKDRDIAFPTPWQREMPPTAILRARLSDNDWGEAVYCDTGDTIYLDAGDSYANLDDGAPLTYAWTPGTDGTITGSGATVTCAYSTEGFRYLKLVVTDAHGTTINRYVPVWVGAGYAVNAMTSARARWTVAGGWTVDLEMQSATTLLQYGQALLVDMETKNALFFGFVVPQSRATTFELTTQGLTLQSALQFSKYVHAYPFLVTAVTGAEEPGEWAEMYDPTLARALWYLLYWHSTLPEVVNCDASAAPVRQIAGQEFTLGSIPQQVDAVLNSAFWQARGARAGGFVVNVDPLYLEEADFLALTGIDLTDPADVRGTLQLEYAMPQYSQARLGGVYRAAGGTFQPSIAQSPIVPCPWGAPTEINGLAPDDSVELIYWAIRFMAVENNADGYSVEPGLAVDPAAYSVADLPDAASTRIAIEQADFGFDTDALRWTHSIRGRSYGIDIGSAATVPQPPDVVYPPPELPPLLPPIWPPIPEELAQWPAEVYVATVTGGIYYTDSFSGPDSAVQPTWSAINDGLTPHSDGYYYVNTFQLDPYSPALYQYAVIFKTGTGGEKALYRRVNRGAWELVLTLDQALAVASLPTHYTSSTYLLMALGLNRSVAGEIFLAITYGGTTLGTRNVRIIKSTSRGDSGTWSPVGNTNVNGFYGISAPYNVIGNVHNLRIQEGAYRSTDGGAAWNTVKSSKVGVFAGISAALPTRQYIRYNNVSPYTHSIGVHIAEVIAAADPLPVVPVSGAPLNLELYGTSVAPVGFGGMWCAPANASLQRVLRRKLSTDTAMELYETTDAWTSAIKIGEITVDLSHKYTQIEQIAEVFGDDYDWMLLGYRTPTVSPLNQPHTVFAWDLDEYTSPIGKAGDAPGTAPYTDSIPYTAGGAIDDGVKYVPDA